MCTHKETDHALGVHALTNEELVVLEVADDLLGEGLSALLEGRDTLGVCLLEVGLNGLHVALKVGKVRLKGEHVLGRHL